MSSSSCVPRQLTSHKYIFLPDGAENGDILRVPIIDLSFVPCKLSTSLSFLALSKDLYATPLMQSRKTFKASCVLAGVGKKGRRPLSKRTVKES